MKAMKIISYIICGLGMLGGVLFLSEGSFSDGFLGILIYGFFLALTVNIKE